MSKEFVLRVSGSDLILSGSLIDSSGNALSGETIVAKVQRTTDDYYWNGAAWVAVDPGTFAVAEIGSTGEYSDTMTAAYAVAVAAYRITITETGVFNRAFPPYVQAFQSNVNLVAIDGQLTSGNNATLYLKQLNIVNNAGDGVHAESTSSGGNGIYAKGYVAGGGISAKGGASGFGIKGAGGASIGHGIVATAPGDIGTDDNTNGMRIERTTAGVGSALRAIVDTALGAGMKIEGSGANDGLVAESGAGATGSGIRAEAKSTNGNGLEVVGKGNASGVKSTGGTSGHGIETTAGGGGSGISAIGGADGRGVEFFGGTNSGAGAIIKARAGNDAGIEAAGFGAGDGIAAESGAGATGSGLRAEAKSVNGHGIETIKTGTGIDLKASDHGDGTWSHSLKKNTAIAKYKFAMRSDTTGELVGGLTVTAERKLDADGAWAGMPNSGTIVDNGSGAYSIDITAADNNGDTGVWKFTAPGGTTTLVTFVTES